MSGGVEGITYKTKVYMEQYEHPNPLFYQNTSQDKAPARCEFLIEYLILKKKINSL